MHICFHCTSCQTLLQAAGSAIGAHVECPRCRHRTTVPKTRFAPRTRIGNFEITRFIGAGGMGEVYAARQLTLEREVALKILPTEFAAKPGVSDRFLKEVRLAASLEHPHIVAAFDAGEDDGLLFMAMSLVRGESLGDRLKNGSMPERDALRMIRPLVAALEYAWTHGQIVHRDIKPANILLDEEGRPRLADLGLSKSLEEQEAMTMSGVVMGTPNYMSPEQAEGHAHVDFRADMYSLGATLYHMLTGQLPFAGSSLMEVLRKQVSESLPDPRDFNPDISEGCIHLMERMLAKNPSERYPDWASLGRDMDAVMKGRALSMGSPPAGGSVLLRRGAAVPHMRIVVPKGGFHPHPPTPVVPPPKPAPESRRRDPDAVRRFALRFAGIGAGFVVLLVIVAVAVNSRRAQGTKSATVPPPSAVAKPAPPAPEAPARLTAAQQVADVRAKLRKLNPGFDGKVVHVAEGDDVVEFEMSAVGVTDISPVAALKKLRRFVCLASTTGLQRSKLSDLKPLAGLSLSELRVPGCDISDLSAVRGMPLKHLGILNTPVRDLSPLQGAPLEVLNCDETVVSDPSNLQALRSLNSLKTVNSKNVAQFWRELGASGRLAARSVDPSFLREVASLTAGEQVNRVVARLKELNPGYDGQVRFEESNNAVVKLSFATVALFDLSPLRALPGLTVLNLAVPNQPDGRTQKGALADLSPLAGMPLTNLCCPNCEVQDLSPLKGMPLKELKVHGTSVRDLGPIGDVPLSVLSIATTHVADLSPLRGMRLEYLDANNSWIGDLAPLADMPLRYLNVERTRVSDLSPLKGIPLKTLFCNREVVAAATNQPLVKAMASLQTINNMPVAEFWRQFEGGGATPVPYAGGGAWVPLGIDAFCNMDIISTASNRPPDMFTYNGGAIASAGWLRKNGFTETGIPDDGLVPIPEAEPAGSFRVRMPPGKNVIFLTGPEGRQPNPVSVFLGPGEIRCCSALAVLEGACWGEGVLWATLHYENGTVTNVHLVLPDWSSKGRTHPRQAGARVAVVTRDTHPQYGLPVELCAHVIPLDPRQKLRSVGLKIGPISPSRGASAQDSEKRFVAAILAMSTLPVEAAAAEAGDAAWSDAIDLLPVVDPQKDANSGSWTRGPGGLVATDITEMSQKLQPPYRPPEEYDYRVSFTPIGGNADVAVGLTAKGRSFVFYMKYMKSDGNHCLGFECIDGKVIASGPTAYRFPHFEMGRRHTVVVQVRRDGLRGYLDGKQVAQWATDYSDMSPYRVWTFKDAGLLGVGCSLSTVVFDEIKVREVSGKGSFLRPDDPAVHAAAEPGASPRGDVIEMLPLVDAQKDAVSGTWRVDGGALTVEPSVFSRLELP